MDVFWNIGETAKQGNLWKKKIFAKGVLAVIIPEKKKNGLIWLAACSRVCRLSIDRDSPFG